MQYSTVCYVSRNFLYSILVLALLIFPFRLMADQPDTISEPQKTVEEQNQTQTPSRQQNTNTSPDILNEEQGKVQYTVLIPILSVLFLGILILLIVIFRAHESFRKQVENRLEHPDEDSRLSDLEEKVNILSESHVNRHSQTLEGTTDYSKDLLPDFKYLLEILIDQNRNIQRSLERITTTLENHSLSQNRNATNQSVENTTTSTDSQDSQRGQEEPLSQILQTFCKVYNDRQEDQLRMSYQPSYQIQVSNTLERREDPNNTPIFETNERGKFWAFYIEDEKLYAVVPVYGLVLERSVYGPGGFNVVFECPDFDYRSRYKNLRVVKPGIFKPDSDLQQWTLIEKGHIDLESSE